MKSFLEKLLLLVVSCCLALVLLEGLARCWAWMQFGAVSVAELDASETGNTFLAELQEGYVATSDGSAGGCAIPTAACVTFRAAR